MKNSNNKRNRYIAFVLLVIMLLSVLPANKASAAEFADTVDAKSAILMEASSGMVLYEQNADQALPPASVTKIMTLLIVMEAIDNGNITMSDMVTVSENAASMGGSQVYLESGEQMSVEDMIKSVVVSSANDAAVALAEHIAGSEASFVSLMNQKAKELGMKNSNFVNTNGLDDNVTDHLISARDIAIMSRELLKHEKILDYTTIWQDSIRDGAFTLSNTNRLIRFYEGANGLKTGSTSKAKFCISATAKRAEMQLICVIMGAPTRDIRNAEAKKLLDYGFANYGVYTYSPIEIGDIKVVGGVSEKLSLITTEYSCVLEKGKIGSVKEQLVYDEVYPAPVKSGDKVGRVVFSLDNEVIGESAIIASNTVEKISFGHVLYRILNKMVSIF